MKKGLIILGILSMLVFSMADNASALLIDFEDLAVRNNFYDMGIESTYQSFSWSPAGSSTGWASATTASRVSSETVTPVSGRSYGWNWDGPQSLFIDFGAPTYVNSAYFANLGPTYGSGNTLTVQLFGYDNSSTLTQTSGILSLSDSFQLLNSGFTDDVYRLEIRGDRERSWFVVDDISLDESIQEDPGPEQDQSVVPEPATMLLFGTGLLGGVFARRKRKA